METQMYPGYGVPSSNMYQGPAPAMFFNHKAEKIDWRRIAAVDLNRITKELDFTALQDTISSIAFCEIEQELDSRYIEPNYVRLFKLAQLQIQYLLYSQDYLTGSLSTEAEKGQAAMDELDKVRRDLAGLRERQVELKKQCHRYKKMVRIQQMLMPSSHDLHHPCPHCDKKFISRDFLANHLERRHKAVNQPMHPIVSLSPGSNSKDVEELREQLKFKSTEIDILRQQMLQGGHVGGENIDLGGLRHDMMRQHKEEMDGLKSMFMEELKDLNAKYLSSEKALQELRVKQNQGSRSNLGELEDDDDAFKLQREQEAKLAEENRKLMADIAREKAINEKRKIDLDRQRAEFENRIMEAREQMARISNVDSEQLPNSSYEENDVSFNNHLPINNNDSMTLVEPFIKTDYKEHQMNATIPSKKEVAQKKTCQPNQISKLQIDTKSNVVQHGPVECSSNSIKMSSKGVSLNETAFPIQSTNVLPHGPVECSSNSIKMSSNGVSRNETAFPIQNTKTETEHESKSLQPPAPSTESIVNVTHTDVSKSKHQTKSIDPNDLSNQCLVSVTSESINHTSDIKNDKFRYQYANDYIKNSNLSSPQKPKKSADSSTDQPHSHYACNSGLNVNDIKQFSQSGDSFAAQHTCSHCASNLNETNMKLPSQFGDSYADQNLRQNESEDKISNSNEVIIKTHTTSAETCVNESPQHSTPKQRGQVENHSLSKKKRQKDAEEKDEALIERRTAAIAAATGSRNNRESAPAQLQTVPSKFQPEDTDEDVTEDESESILVSKEMKKTLADTGPMGTGEMSATSSWDISQLRSSRVMEKLKAEPKLLQGFISELKLMLEEKLMELGVDKNAKRLSTPVLNEKLAILRKERDQLARKHVRFAAIRQQYVREVERDAQEQLRGHPEHIEPDNRVRAQSNSLPPGVQRSVNGPRPPPRPSPQADRRSATLPIPSSPNENRPQPSAPAAPLVPSLRQRDLESESETESDESYSAIGEHNNRLNQPFMNGVQAAAPSAPELDSDVRPSPRKPRQHRPLSASNGINKLDSPESIADWDTIDGRKLSQQGAGDIVIPSRTVKKEEESDSDDWDDDEDEMEQLEKELASGSNIDYLRHSLQNQMQNSRDSRPAGGISLFPRASAHEEDDPIADILDDEDDAFDVSSLNGEDSRPPSRKISGSGHERGMSGARTSVGSSGGAGGQNSSPSGQLRLSNAGTDLSNTFGTSQWGTTSKVVSTVNPGATQKSMATNKSSDVGGDDDFDSD